MLTGNVLKDPDYIYRYHTGQLKAPNNCPIEPNFGKWADCCAERCRTDHRPDPIRPVRSFLGSVLVSAYVTAAVIILRNMRSLTIRLPDHLAAEMKAESRERNCAKSDIARERLQRGGGPSTGPPTRLNLIADLIGSADGLPADLSGRKKRLLRTSGYGKERGGPAGSRKRVVFRHDLRPYRRPWGQPPLRYEQPAQISPVMTAICDTGPLVAYFNRNDPHDKWAVAVSNAVRKSRTCFELCRRIEPARRRWRSGGCRRACYDHGREGRSSPIRRWCSPSHGAVGPSSR